MTKYELSRLLEYDENGILEEIRRVAGLIPSPTMSARAFDKLSKVESSTVRKRFGGWRNALEKAGLGHRYSGAVVTDRMRSTEKHTNKDIVNELKRVAEQLGSQTFTAKKFDSIACIHSATAVRHFGSWAKALKQAGLEPGKGATRLHRWRLLRESRQVMDSLWKATEVRRDGFASLGVIFGSIRAQMGKIDERASRLCGKNG